jgi:repressor LexA
MPAMVQTERDPRKSLSPKQLSILKFIRSFLRDKDYPPSIRDIQEGCDISHVRGRLQPQGAERLGYIRRDREVSRAIELLERGARRRGFTPCRWSASSPPASHSRAAADTWSQGEYEDAVEVTDEMTAVGRTFSPSASKAPR